VRFASEEVELSLKERKMVSRISRNPRVSFTKMVKEIKSSKARTRVLFEGLKEKEVLLIIRPSINTTKLGYLPKHVLIKLKFHAMNKLDSMV
jgi:DNA-binding Lrp family transcriptional regulator